MARDTRSRCPSAGLRASCLVSSGGFLNHSSTGRPAKLFNACDVPKSIVAKFGVLGH